MNIKDGANGEHRHKGPQLTSPSPERKEAVRKNIWSRAESKSTRAASSARTVARYGSRSVKQHSFDENRVKYLI